MGTLPKIRILCLLAVMVFGGSIGAQNRYVQDVQGSRPMDSTQIWLSHEHILVDFIGADSIQPKSWNHKTIIAEISPYLEEIAALNVNYFVDATPAYLGRDVHLLEKMAVKTGLRIVTNTGLYGARNNKFLPNYVQEITVEDLSEKWIDEFENGIDGTSIKPGFIKIGVDATDPLDTLHQKLIKAAALTSLRTGLTIASHTGNAVGLWPQLQIIKETGLPTDSFIWVHAQAEEDNSAYLKAASMGCWISLDGIGWEVDRHLKKLLFAKEHGILDRILISHDAGWFDPQKQKQTITPYTNIFTDLLPELRLQGFTEEEIKLLIAVNPSKAFSIERE